MINKEIQNKAEISNYIVYLYLLLTSAVFILLFSKATSPLFTFYGYDSCIFITMSEMWLSGKAIYVDCFDHKGPALFFIEAMGQILIKGRTGIYFLQVFNLFVSLVFLYKTAKMFTLSYIERVFIIITFLLLFCFTIEDGNQTEEASMPYILASVYLTFRCYFGDKKWSELGFFLIGVCLSIIFWIRPTNAGIVCACIAFLIIVSIRQKKYRETFKKLLLFACGFIVISSIIFVYFIYSNSFDEMMYASFTFNFKYMARQINTNYSLRELLQSVMLNICILSTLIIGVYLLYKKEKDFNIVIFFILLLVLNFIPVNMVKMGLFQYKLLLIPMFSIGLIFLFKSEQFKIANKLLISLSLAVSLLMGGVFIASYQQYKDYDTAFIDSARKMEELIPIDERSKTFGYNVEAKTFMITNLRPTFKFYIFQEWHGRSDKKVTDEVNKMMIEQTPLWVFTQRKLMEDCENTFLLDLLENKYEIVFDDTNLTLYHLK